jgi:hypothetical protein
MLNLKEVSGYHLTNITQTDIIERNSSSSFDDNNNTTSTTYTTGPTKPDNNTQGRLAQKL